MYDVTWKNRNRFDNGSSFLPFLLINWLFLDYSIFFDISLWRILLLVLAIMIENYKYANVLFTNEMFLILTILWLLFSASSPIQNICIEKKGKILISMELCHLWILLWFSLRSYFCSCLFNWSIWTGSCHPLILRILMSQTQHLPVHHMPL